MMGLQIHYVAYDAGGRIVGTGSCPDTALALQNLPGATYMQGDGSETQTTHYVLSDVITLRPPSPVTVSIFGRVVTLNGVPSGAPYSVSGAGTITGVSDASGTLVLTFGAAGTFQINVACFPAQDFNQGVTLV